MKYYVSNEPCKNQHIRSVAKKNYSIHPGQFFMGTNLLAGTNLLQNIFVPKKKPVWAMWNCLVSMAIHYTIGTNLLQNIFVPKKKPVWAMWNCLVSMAIHYTILNNESIHSILIISQPVFTIEWQIWYQIKVRHHPFILYSNMQISSFA